MWSTWSPTLTGASVCLSEKWEQTSLLEMQLWGFMETCRAWISHLGSMDASPHSSIHLFLNYFTNSSIILFTHLFIYLFTHSLMHPSATPQSLGSLGRTSEATGPWVGTAPGSLSRNNGFHLTEPIPGSLPREGSVGVPPPTGCCLPHHFRLSPKKWVSTSKSLGRMLADNRKSPYIVDI